MRENNELRIWKKCLTFCCCFAGTGRTKKIIIIIIIRKNGLKVEKFFPSESKKY